MQATAKVTRSSWTQSDCWFSHTRQAARSDFINKQKYSTRCLRSKIVGLCCLATENNKKYKQKHLITQHNTNSCAEISENITENHDGRAFGLTSASLVVAGKDNNGIILMTCYRRFLQTCNDCVFRKIQLNIQTIRQSTMQ